MAKYTLLVLGMLLLFAESILGSNIYQNEAENKYRNAQGTLWEHRNNGEMYSRSKSSPESKSVLKSKFKPVPTKATTSIPTIKFSSLSPSRRSKGGKHGKGDPHSPTKSKAISQMPTAVPVKSIPSLVLVGTFAPFGDTLASPPIILG